MSGRVEYDLREGVAILSVRNPPVNALGHAVRRALWDGIERAEADGEVGAVLIRAEGRTFPAGADMEEFDAPSRAPALTDLCDRIEACTKPVLAAIHGTALGGGFELALACHYRVAEQGARLGLPEVGLGLLPGAGGTQRLPRLCGAGPALEIMLTGKPIDAEEAEPLGLIDRVVKRKPGKAGFATARDMARGARAPQPTGARRDGLADATGFLEAVAAKRAEIADAGAHNPALARIVDCVEAALLLPLEAGLAMERAAFGDLVRTDQSRALRHVFFAERRAAKFPELAGGVGPRPVERVGIVGAGPTGSGIAIACLDGGLPVTLVDRNDEAAARGRARIAAVYERMVARERMTAAARDARLARLETSGRPEDLASADLVIEAGPEDASLRRGLFERLDRVMKPGAILASNSPMADADALAEATGRADAVLGLHFTPPVLSNRLVELAPGKFSAGDAVAAGVAFARRLGKTPVRAGNRPGRIGAPVLAAYFLAVDGLIAEGASPARIDQVMRAYGFAAGPCQAQDLAGLDAVQGLLHRMQGGAEQRGQTLVDRLVAQGRLGHRTGRGFYRYREGSRIPEDDRETAELIEAGRADPGGARAGPGNQDIRDRCLDAMANAGARLVEDEVAACPSDIDVAMIHGYGFPRWRGGPMMQADLTGLLTVAKRLRGYGAQIPGIGEPAQLFDGLVKNGLSFWAMNLA